MVSIMNRLRAAQRAAVVKALVEGNSIRSTVRLTGVAKNTVTKLLVELGLVCAEYQDRTIKNLPCKRIQCDEIWSFVVAKAKNVTNEVRKREPNAGDAWTWTAICADTKLCVSFAIGDRTLNTAWPFMQDVASRLKHRVQITTDGYRPYLTAIEDAFGVDVDYAQLVKIYGQTSTEDQRRYSPVECIGCVPTTITGNPDPKHISTSFVERQNLSMRMGMRRFTRLTNAFSKKIENHMAAVSLYFMWYNFGRVHQTLRVTPAMEAGLTDHVWTVDEVVALLDFTAVR